MKKYTTDHFDLYKNSEKFYGGFLFFRQDQKLGPVHSKLRNPPSKHICRHSALKKLRTYLIHRCWSRETVQSVTGPRSLCHYEESRHWRWALFETCLRPTHLLPSCLSPSVVCTNSCPLVQHAEVRLPIWLSSGEDLPWIFPSEMLSSPVCIIVLVVIKKQMLWNSVVDPHRSLLNLVGWIRIQEGKMAHKKRKK